MLTSLTSQCARSPSVALLALTACATSLPERRPDLPRGYEQYQAPAVCADTTVPRTPPLPTDYQDIQLQAALMRPDLISRTSPARVAFLWYFIREDGQTAEVRPWRSSGSRPIDDLALQ